MDNVTAQRAAEIRALDRSGRQALRPHREGHQEVRRLHRGRRRVAGHLQEGDLLPARRVGLRQDHAAAHAGRVRAADLGQDLHRRRRHDLDPAVRAAGQHDVPVVCGLPAHDGRAERRLRPQAGGPAEGRDRAARRRHAQPGQARAVRQAQAAPAVGRTAPARRAGALAGQEAEAAAARRAARGARQEAARTHAVRADQHPGDARRDVHRRDARPGGGDDAVLAHRTDEPRRDRPGRHAERDLRVPEFALRRGVHRFGEHVRGPADRGRAVLRPHRHATTSRRRSTSTTA